MNIGKEKCNMAKHRIIDLLLSRCGHCSLCSSFATWVASRSRTRGVKIAFGFDIVTAATTLSCIVFRGGAMLATRVSTTLLAVISAWSTSFLSILRFSIERRCWCSSIVPGWCGRVSSIIRCWRWSSSRRHDICSRVTTAGIVCSLFGSIHEEFIWFLNCDKEPFTVFVLVRMIFASKLQVCFPHHLRSRESGTQQSRVCILFKYVHNLGNRSINCI